MLMCSKWPSSTCLLCSSRVLVLFLHSQTSTKLHILYTVVKMPALKFRALQVDLKVQYFCSRKLLRKPQEPTIFASWPKK